MKIAVGLRVNSPHHNGTGKYLDEVVEVLPNLVAVKSLDYPFHDIRWWKIDEFKKYYHYEGAFEHDCKCWD
jgi:hypothetical protein